jgi:hypothetical protein
MDELSEEQRWMLASAGSAVVAAVVTRVAARSGWKWLSGEDPPRNPAAPGTSWAQAFAWAVGTGMIVGISRVLAERAATGSWRKLTGHTPRPIRW